MAHRWLILSIYTAALLFATHVPLRLHAKPRTGSWFDTVLVSIERLARGSMPGGFGRGDKIFHAIAYAGLTLLVFRAMENPRDGVTASEKRRWRIGAGWIICLLLAFALFDETTQPLFTRTLDWIDYVANVVGILSMATLLIAADVLAQIDRRTQLNSIQVKADSKLS